ncbi:MAG: acetyl-CoA carboxylase biotin carboxylase subunit [Candidatus Latescibacteria bacterium]|nr:acetyl-CoA carboxylase biotin carboxylase subunit [Candidatus Latescibacterota bacterium]
MFDKILIANRGEIAVRIIRACRELGVKTVAVFSEADRTSLHTELADQQICIGGPLADESYLNIPRVLSAAEVTGCDAIHPGYGFLSENPDFAEACEACQIKFIGPKSTVIRMMGDKLVARQKMREAGLSVLPGSAGAVETVKEVRKIADEIGYPIIIKAAAGGGGKGMRIVRQERDLEAGVRLAQAEAKASFNDERVYIEKYIENSRHIEVQILADSFGNTTHLFERECSIQRRHQKLIEEAPSPLMDEQARINLCDAAVKGAQSIGYESAGTMEFIATQDKHFYFLEMNTRVQVEHPITEAVTNVDIVKHQIAMAAGEKLAVSSETLKNPIGYALECRINAEDEANDFMPTPGKITELRLPAGPGIRVDSFIYQGYSIAPYYDSLIGKFISWAPTRKEAIVRMERALKETVITGIKTIIPFHLRILAHPDFRAGNLSTSLIEMVK